MGKVCHVRAEEITKAIKDEFAYANGKGKNIKRLDITDQGKGNYKMEIWYN